MSDTRKPSHVKWKPTRIENLEEVKCCVTSVLNVMTYIKVEKGKRTGGTVYRQLKLRTVACGHITDVSTLIIKCPGIGSGSKDRHASIAFPVNLASVPKILSLKT